MSCHEELGEDSMFGKQFVTAAEEIEEARVALIEVGKEIAPRRIDAEFNEAQIVFANANARMEPAPPGDDEANKEAEAANRRLLALFRKNWKRTRGCCSLLSRIQEASVLSPPGGGRQSHTMRTATASSSSTSVDPTNLGTGRVTETHVPVSEESIFISPLKCRSRSRIPLIPTPEPRD